MKRHNTQSLLILVSLWLVCSCASNPRKDVEPARAGPNDQATLTLAAQKFLGAFDKLDWESFQSLWASNPTAFFPFADTPERVEGSAVMTRFRQFFDDVRSSQPGPPYLRLNPQGLRADTFGSTGIVTFTFGRRPGNVGRRTLVFVIENGEWKLVHLHASVAEPADP